MAAQKVLIADDSKFTHVFIAARLPNEGIEIHSAYDGKQALEMAHAILPDLILLDVEMPGVSGWEVCQSLKADELTKAIPVIFLTAENNMEQKLHGLELGAMDYVTKPFHPAELKARIHSALRMKELVDLLAEQAMIDALTGLRNRRYFDQRLKAELAMAKRRDQPIACVIADVDHFKNFNDKHGHAVGDEVLRLVGRVFRSGARAEDIVCRYGGEEFVMLLPQTSREGAVKLAERYRSHLASMTLEIEEIKLQITASFGVSELTLDGAERLVEAADKALYGAKTAGRNCVRASSNAPNSATEPVSKSETISGLCPSPLPLAS